MKNCRAWFCCDDGFDAPGDGVIRFTNCWSFAHGVDVTTGKRLIVEGSYYEGNGFKTGGSYVDHNTPRVILTNCISAYSGGHGLYIVEYPECYRTRVRIYNTTIYKNLVGLTISHSSDNRTDSESIIRNSIVYNSTSIDPMGRLYELDAIAEFFSN